jgi:hypothetical protein
VLEQGLRGRPRQGEQGSDRLGGEATVVAFLLRGQTQQGGPFGGLARGAHVRHRVDEAHGDGAAENERGKGQKDQALGRRS